MSRLRLNQPNLVNKTTMKFFPSLDKKYSFISSQEETFERLARRTLISDSLVSQKTDKSFIGKINDKSFRLISSTIGKGALCVLTGNIHGEYLHVKVELNHAFQVLFSILLVLPIIAFISTYFSDPENFTPVLYIVFPLQILFVKFIFIDFTFKYLSKNSLNKLRDIMDLE